MDNKGILIKTLPGSLFGEFRKVVEFCLRLPPGTYFVITADSLVRFINDIARRPGVACTGAPHCTNNACSVCKPGP